MIAMDEYQDIKELLKPKRTFEASSQLRRRISDVAICDSNTGKKSWWVRSGAAAACLIMIAGTAMLLNNNIAVPPLTDDNCIVYVSGQKASGDEAQAIAEADVVKMEQFMQIVAQQNATEKEKVNQFIQHNSLQK